MNFAGVSSGVLYGTDPKFSLQCRHRCTAGNWIYQLLKYSQCQSFYLYIGEILQISQIILYHHIHLLFNFKSPPEPYMRARPQNHIPYIFGPFRGINDLIQFLKIDL